MREHRDDEDSSEAPLPNAATFMLGAIADTTWRMFIPSIGGTLLGVWADKQFGTTPLFIIIGILVGSSLAGVLVWRLLKRQ